MDAFAVGMWRDMWGGMREGMGKARGKRARSGCHGGRTRLGAECTDAHSETATGAVRSGGTELLEESGVRAAKLVPRGRLDFEFEGDPKILEVHVFECTELHEDAATPYETDEMRPAWYDVDAIPYSKMWIDDVHWLPLVLQGESVSYYFVFRGHDIVLSRRALTDAELAECALTDRFGPAAP